MQYFVEKCKFLRKKGHRFTMSCRRRYLYIFNAIISAIELPRIPACYPKKQEYYEQKEQLLSVVEPTCIHKEHFGFAKIRSYDYQEEYKKNRKRFVWENCYFDRELGREVWFGDVLDKTSPIYHYYLFYDINGTKTFHSPISESDIEYYRN